MIKILVLLLPFMMASPVRALLTTHSYEPGEKIVIFYKELSVSGQEVPLTAELAKSDDIVHELFNRKGRVYAERVEGPFNQTNVTAYFKGSAKDVQSFIKKMGSLQYAYVWIELHAEKAAPKQPLAFSQKEPFLYDWSINYSNPYQSAGYPDPVIEGRMNSSYADGTGLRPDCSVTITVYDAKNRLKGFKLPENLKDARPPVITSPKQSTRLEIYALKDKSITGAQMDKLDINSVTLEDEPLIPADDIIAYDSRRQRLHLKTAAISRIGKPGPMGRPLVICSDGKRLFVLGIWTQYSSYIPSFPVTYWESINKSRNAIVLHNLRITSDDKTERDPLVELKEIMKRNGMLLDDAIAGSRLTVEPKENEDAD